MFLGATYGTEATSALTPIGLTGPGGSARCAPERILGGAGRLPRRRPPSRVGCECAVGSAKASSPPGVTPKPRDGEAQWIGVRPPPLPEGGMGIGLGRSHPSPLGGVRGYGSVRRGYRQDELRSEGTPEVRGATRGPSSLHAFSEHKPASLSQRQKRAHAHATHEEQRSVCVPHACTS